MAVPKISKQQLAKLKRNLPQGAIKKIADEKNVSEMLVSSVLAGKKTDLHGIVVRAAELALEHKEKTDTEKAATIIDSL